ncbi:chromate efflux transporter [Aquabacter spiritensis]|uniref:Chromate transporter n=1 Tax=Aquabacter spiritensis TaxID=933073 RepID=A0A4R3LPP2_9HYPH|nr:chromate efflux transporter [Aquabacter spiritensis]TCT02453.1 chromate transporter [Aquabacter spiritensis]
MRTGRVGEVFTAFLWLGLVSFGGPIAHLGYFRETFVVRRRWLSEADYADLVALCQFLPGPASSQVGFALGILRAGGVGGGIAAFFGFTLPSALLLAGFGLAAAQIAGPAAEALLHGLKLVAVAVVAQAVWGMARSLAPDRFRAGIAFLAFAISLLAGGPFAQVLAIAFGAVANLAFDRTAPTPPTGRLEVPIARRAGIIALVLALGLLLAIGGLATAGVSPARFLDAFYRSGALVFGGGHVVLPLLEAATVAPGWVTPDDFLAGYGLAQAVPGPLFTFAAYLGALVGGLGGAAAALFAIFLPGLLLVYGTLPFWDRLRSDRRTQAGMRGANAAVVGVLGAAFYDPVFTSAVLTPWDAVLALGGFLLVTIGNMPAWSAVLLLPLASLLVR